MGYGNLGRGVELALRNSPDMEFVAVFSRRDPAKVSIKTTDVPVISVTISTLTKIRSMSSLSAAAVQRTCLNRRRNM